MFMREAENWHYLRPSIIEILDQIPDQILDQILHPILGKIPNQIIFILDKILIQFPNR